MLKNQGPVTSDMSEEQLKAFLEAVKGDSALQEKLKAAGDAEVVVAIAKEAGFLISAEELKKAQTEVSEEELENTAAGGGVFESLAVCVTKNKNSVIGCYNC